MILTDGSVAINFMSDDMLKIARVLSVVASCLVVVMYWRRGLAVSGADMVVVSETRAGSNESCPTWHVFNNESKECTCQSLEDIVRCDDKTSTEAVSLLYGYCMTYSADTKVTHVGKCSYTVFSRQNDSLYTSLPQNPLELNQCMCGQWHRDGYLCDRCDESHGLSIANFYMTCEQCSMRDGVGWLPFLLMQLVPVTVLFVVVVVFRLSITQPPFNAFVFHSQLNLAIIYIYAAKFQSPFLTTSASQTLVTLRNIFLPILGVWNLGSFSLIKGLTSFCVAVDVNHQQFYFLTYITSFHVLLLVVITFICIELHARNCRIIVCLWRPFFKCFVRFSRVWTSKRTIVDTFATFLLLSYSRLVLLSFFIYAVQRVYILNKILDSKIVLLYYPEVEFFDRSHLPYALINFLLLIVFVFIPGITLALYQAKLFQECLRCLNLHRCLSLRIFVELFQRSYKDGTAGTHDLRFTASLYLFLRVILLLAHVMCGLSNFAGCSAVVSLVLLLATILFIVVLQPYKDNRMNKVDIALLVVVMLSSALLSSVSESRDTTVNAIVVVMVLVLVSIPQIVFYSFLIYKLSLSLSKLQCCQRVRRKYHIRRMDSRDELSLSQIDSIALETLSGDRLTASYEEANSVRNGLPATNGSTY